MNDKLIYISAGETSGDLLGSEVIKELLAKDPYLKIKGIGGSQMVIQGLDPVFRTEEFGFMGVFEILRHIFFINKVMRTMVKKISDDQPKVILLIDFSEFHIKLAKKLKKQGVTAKIIKYVSPQIWASRHNRINDIEKYYDCLCCILPFEKELYKGRNIDCRYVGHPLLDKIKIRYGKNDFYKFLNTDASKKIVSIFPGSRDQELKYHFEEIINAIRMLNDKRSDLKFYLCKSENINLEEHNQVLVSEGIDVVDAVYQWELIKYSDVVLCKSGTTSLQTAIMKTPAVIFYKLNKLTFKIAERIIKTEFISLPNIIAEKKIIPELIQNDFTAENIVAEVLKYLEEPEHYMNTVDELTKISELIGEPGAGRKVADTVLEYIT